MPKLDREQAISLAVLAVLMLVCLLAAGMSLQAHFDAAQERAERVELLSRLEAHIRADGGRPVGTAPATAFLNAATQGLASAQLQAYLVQLSDSQHAGLMSSSGEIAKRDEAPDTIRLQTTLDTDMTSLRGMLYQLEAGTPYVFVDALTVQTAGTPGRPVEDPPLRATLGLRAFWRQKLP